MTVHRGDSDRHRHRSLVIAIGLAVSAAPATASEFSEDLSERMFFEEIPVVLSATRLQQSISDSPAAITIIDRAMIEASGAIRLVDLLRLIPGMHVGYISGSRFTVSEHGIADRYARRLQVMIDGRPVYDPGFGGVSWFNMPLDIDEIHKIEAIRGPNAAAYGSNAFSGVINIITKHPATDAGTLFKGMVGSNDRGAAYLGHTGTQGSLDYRVSLKYQEDGGFKQRFDQSYQTWFNIRGNWQIDNDDELLFQAGINDGSREEGFRDDIVNFPRDNGQQYNYQQLRWTRHTETGSDYSLQFYHNRLSINDNFILPVEIPGIPMPLSAGFGFNSDRYDIEFQATQALSPEARLIWGLGGRHDTTESIWAFNARDAFERDQGRMFANTEWHPTPQLSVNLGAMAEFTEGLKPLFSPRLGLNFHIDRSNTLRFSASQAYRMPSLFEEYADQMVFMGEDLQPFNRWYYSLGGLDPEKIKSMEIGYVGSFTKQGLSVNARLFREEVTSMITNVFDLTIEDPVPIPGLDDGTERAMNGGEYRIQGFEIGLRYAPTPRGFIYLGGSYLDTQGEQLRLIKDSDEPHKWEKPRVLSRYVAKRLLSILGSYRFDNGLRLSSGFYYSSEVRWAGDGDYVPSYNRWDVKLDRNFQLVETDLNLALIYRHIDAGQVDFYSNAEDLRINEWDDGIFLEAKLAF